VSASNAAIAVEARRGVSDEVRIAGIKPAGISRGSSERSFRNVSEY
jgi:hypothetical protein